MRTFTFALALAFTLGLTACESEEPIEEAGDAYEETMEDRGDAVEENYEEAGEAIDEAYEAEGEAVEEATEEIADDDAL